MVKRLLLSGVSSGMGKVAAEHFAGKGYDVVSIGRTAIHGMQNITLDFACVPTSEQLGHAFQDVTPFDGFINCAGLLPGKDFRNYTPDLRTELFNINVFTPVALVDFLTDKQYLNPNAAIVMLSSISAYKGSFDDFYAASKGALNSLIKSLALKLAPTYRVMGIAPGMTEHTRMTDQLVEGRFEHNLKLIPAGQAVQPQEIAHLLEYVVEHGKSMVGNVIDINGGQYLR